MNAVAIHPWPTQRLFGLDFVADATIADAAQWLVAERDSARGDWRTVVTPNVDHIVTYERDPAMFAVAREAAVLLPDGMPIVWASRLLRRPLARRMSGSDLFSAMWPVLAELAVPVVAVPPTAEVGRLLAAELPGVELVEAPWFAVDDTDAIAALAAAVVTACDAADARFCMLGLPMDKQHRLVPVMRRLWEERGGDRPIVMLMGAALELHVGATRRAPRWMQRSGLEWLFRITQDPRRLAKRYLVDDTRFVRSVWREWRADR